MKSKVFVFSLVISIISAGGAWAQNLPAFPEKTSSIWTSPQSSTTEGRYRSNADDFIRPDTYTGVKFNKWFGMASFQWDDNYSGIATLGFATKVSNVYIGAFYNGNMWAGMPANNYSEYEPATVPNGGSTGKVYDVYNSISVSGTNPINNTAILIGFADMGVRLTYRTNYLSFKQSDIVTGSQLYQNYQAEYGYIAPQLAWAMASEVTSK